jgi:hypothetical protein
MSYRSVKTLRHPKAKFSQTAKPLPLFIDQYCGEPEGAGFLKA